MTQSKVEVLPLYPVVIYREEGKPGTSTGVCPPEMDIQAAMDAAEAATVAVGAVEPILGILPMYMEAEDITPRVFAKHCVACKGVLPGSGGKWVVRRDFQESLVSVPEEVVVFSTEVES